MARYCALIADELMSWPKVTRRQMFGLALFYRESLPFIALPDTRDFEAADRVGFKLYTPNKCEKAAMLAEERISARAGAKWTTFALREDGDLNEFLRWAGISYASCERA